MSDKLSKREIIWITLSLQNKVEAYNSVNTDALEEIHNFNKNFVRLESEISIVKMFNTFLKKKEADMEIWKGNAGQMSSIQERSVWKL